MIKAYVKTGAMEGSVVVIGEVVFEDLVMVFDGRDTAIKSISDLEVLEPIDLSKGLTIWQWALLVLAGGLMIVMNVDLTIGILIGVIISIWRYESRG
jgi:hypothetical protein